jgi:hypothetical protein
MALIDLVIRERVPEASREGLLEVAPLGETLVHAGNIFRLKLLYPTCIIESLCHDLTRCATALVLDEDQAAIRRHGNEIDILPVCRPLLPPNQHPFIREDGGTADDHGLKYFFRGEAR